MRALKKTQWAKPEIVPLEVVRARRLILKAISTMSDDPELADAVSELRSIIEIIDTTMLARL